MNQTNEPAISAEQLARDMLERAGVSNAKTMTAGSLVEIANLIAKQGITSAEYAKLKEDAERYYWMKFNVKRIPDGWDLIGWDNGIALAGGPKNDHR